MERPALARTGIHHIRNVALEYFPTAFPDRKPPVTLSKPAPRGMKEIGQRIVIGEEPGRFPCPGQRHKLRSMWQYPQFRRDSSFSGHRSARLQV